MEDQEETTKTKIIKVVEPDASFSSAEEEGSQESAGSPPQDDSIVFIKHSSRQFTKQHPKARLAKIIKESEAKNLPVAVPEQERSSEESAENDSKGEELKMPASSPENLPRKKGKYSQKLKKLFKHYILLKKIKNYNAIQKMMANAPRVQSRGSVADQGRRSNEGQVGAITIQNQTKALLEPRSSSHGGNYNLARDSLSSLHLGSQASSTSPVRRMQQNYRDQVPQNLRDKFIHLMKLRQCEIACSDQQVMAKVERLTKAAMARIKDLPLSQQGLTTQEDAEETSSCDREELGDDVGDLQVTQMSKQTTDSQEVRGRRKTRVRGTALFVQPSDENEPKSLKPLKSSPTNADVQFKLKKGRSSKRPRKNSNVSDSAAENQPYRRQSMMRFDVVEQAQSRISYHKALITKYGDDVENIKKPSQVQRQYLEKYMTVQTVDAYKEQIRTMKQAQNQKFIDRIKYQQKVRVQFNMKILREDGRMEKRANSKWYQLNKETTNKNTTSVVSKGNTSRSSSSNKLSSSLSSSDVSFDDDSFKSDDSYYDEDEEFEIACMNQEQQAVRDHQKIIGASNVKKVVLKKNFKPQVNSFIKKTIKMASIGQKRNQLLALPLDQSSDSENEAMDVDDKIVQIEAKKLNEIFKVSEVLNVAKIQDRDVVQISKFFKSLPIFAERFEILSKAQIRSCLEKIKINLVERGEELQLKPSKKNTRLGRNQAYDSRAPRKNPMGKQRKFAYVILVGCVNVYDLSLPRDEPWIDENELRECIGEESTQRTETGRATSREPSDRDQVKKKKEQSTFVTQNSSEDQIIKIENQRGPQEITTIQTRNSQLGKPQVKVRQELSREDRERWMWEVDETKGDLESVNTEFLENFNVDDQLIDIYQSQSQKVKSLHAGEFIGKLNAFDPDHQRGAEGDSEDSDEERKVYISKSDCIVIQMEQDVFEIVMKQKLRREREFVTDHLVKSLPKLNRLYTTMKINENAFYHCQETIFKKGEFIQREVMNDKSRVPVDQKKLYFLVEGQVKISKYVKYLDQNDEWAYKDEDIMVIHSPDIIGEDYLWYDGRDESYSAKAITSKQSGHEEVKCLAITQNDFLKCFGKVIPTQQKMFDMRNVFLMQRYEALRYQNEFNSISFNNKVPLKLQSDWEVQNSKQFQDESNHHIQKKLKGQFLRDDMLTKQPYPVVVNLCTEMEKQKKQNEPIKTVKKEFEVRKLPDWVGQSNMYPNDVYSSISNSLHPNNQSIDLPNMIQHSQTAKKKPQKQTIELGATVVRQASLFKGRSRMSKDQQISRDRNQALSSLGPNPYDNNSFSSKHQSLILNNLKSTVRSDAGGSLPVSYRKGQNETLVPGHIQVSNQRMKKNMGNLELNVVKAESQESITAREEQHAESVKNSAPEQYTLRKLETMGDYFNVNDYKDAPQAKQYSLKDLHETTEVRIHKKMLVKNDPSLESSFKLVHNNGQFSQEKLDGTLEIPGSVRNSKGEIGIHRDPSGGKMNDLKQHGQKDSNNHLLQSADTNNRFSPGPREPRMLMDTLPRKGSQETVERASVQDAEAQQSQEQTARKKRSTPGPGSVHISSRPIQTTHSKQTFKKEQDIKSQVPASLNLYNTAYQSTAKKRYAHHKKFRPDIKNIADQEKEETSKDNMSVPIDQFDSDLGQEMMQNVVDGTITSKYNSPQKWREVNHSLQPRPMFQTASEKQNPWLRGSMQINNSSGQITRVSQNLTLYKKNAGFVKDGNNPRLKNNGVDISSAQSLQEFKVKSRQGHNLRFQGANGQSLDDQKQCYVQQVILKKGLHHMKRKKKFQDIIRSKSSLNNIMQLSQNSKFLPELPQGQKNPLNQYTRSIETRYNTNQSIFGAPKSSISKNDQPYLDAYKKDLSAMDDLYNKAAFRKSHQGPFSMQSDYENQARESFVHNTSIEMDKFDQSLNQRPDAAMFSTQISRSALSISVMSKKGKQRDGSHKYNHSKNGGPSQQQSTYQDLSKVNNDRAQTSSAISGLVSGTKMLLKRGEQRHNKQAHFDGTSDTKDAEHRTLTANQVESSRSKLPEQHDTVNGNNLLRKNLGFIQKQQNGSIKIHDSEPTQPLEQTQKTVDIHQSSTKNSVVGKTPPILLSQQNTKRVVPAQKRVMNVKAIQEMHVESFSQQNRKHTPEQEHTQELYNEDSAEMELISDYRIVPSDRV